MPPFGKLDLAIAAMAAPVLSEFATEVVELENARLLQVITEVEGAGELELLPPALHPTSPPTAVWQVLEAPTSPWGPFRMASVRIGARAGTKSRGYLAATFVDNEVAAAALAASWGFPCVGADVSLRVGHDRIQGTAGRDGETWFDVELRDPSPIAPGSVFYAASMHLAHTPIGLRLVQVDPEYVITDVQRGQPLVAFSNTKIDERLLPTWPVSATVATVTVSLPVIRFACDPGLPATATTESVAGAHT